MADSQLGRQQGDFWQRVESRTVGDVVNREASVALGDGHVQRWGQVGEDVAGYALGNAAILGIKDYQARKQTKLNDSLKQLQESEKKLYAQTQASLDAQMSTIGADAGQAMFDQAWQGVEQGIDRRIDDGLQAQLAQSEQGTGLPGEAASRAMPSPDDGVSGQYSGMPLNGEAGPSVDYLVAPEGAVTGSAAPQPASDTPTSDYMGRLRQLVPSLNALRTDPSVDHEAWNRARMLTEQATQAVVDHADDAGALVRQAEESAASLMPVTALPQVMVTPGGNDHAPGTQMPHVATAAENAAFIAGLDAEAQWRSDQLDYKRVQAARAADAAHQRDIERRVQAFKEADYRMLGHGVIGFAKAVGRMGVDTLNLGVRASPGLGLYNMFKPDSWPDATIPTPGFLQPSDLAEEGAGKATPWVLMAVSAPDALETGAVLLDRAVTAFSPRVSAFFANLRGASTLADAGSTAEVTETVSTASKASSLQGTYDGNMWDAGSLPGALRYDVSDNTVGGLFRKTANTGEFAGLKVPMQMRYVDQAAADAGVGLQGVKVRIVRDPELIGRNTFGYTYPDGSIDLYPDAFTDTEQLVKTLGHERTHTMQIDIFGHPDTHGSNVMFELQQNERAAHGVEDSFWKYYLRNNSGRLERYR